MGAPAPGERVSLEVVTPPGYGPERGWILDVVLGERLGLAHVQRAEERRDVAFRLAGDPSGAELLLSDVLFAGDERGWPAAAPAPRPLAWEAAAAFPEAPLVAPSLPVLYGEAAATVGPGRIELGADLLGSAFWLLTRFEELEPASLDEHGRFPASASLAARHGFLDRPLVDEYALLLLAALRRLFPRLPEPRPRPALAVSHDVDVPLCRAGSPAATARLVAVDLARRRDPGLAARRLAATLTRDPRRDVCNTFDWLMDEHEARGQRGAFYVIAGGDDPRDAAYSLEEPWLRGLLRRIHERGHELGLHPSYASYDAPATIAAEAAALRTTCAALGIELEAVGGRQHFLRFANPATWRGWDEAGLAYDSTLSFAERPGFRCGACFEYPVFDVPARRRLRVRERPLVAMEASLLQYQALSDEAAAASLAELKRRCRLVGGTFTLLWHNDRLQSRARRRLYLGALDA